MAQPADPKSVLDAIKETHAEAEQIGGSADGTLAQVTRARTKFSAISHDVRRAAEYYV